VGSFTPKRRRRLFNITLVASFIHFTILGSKLIDAACSGLIVIGIKPNPHASVRVARTIYEMNMMNKSLIRLIVVVAVIFSGCSNESYKIKSMNAAENEIYSRVIDSLYKFKADSFICIADSTNRNHFVQTIRYFRNGAWHEISEFDKLNYKDSIWEKFDNVELGNDYTTKNEGRFLVDLDKIHCLFKTQRVSSDSLFKIFSSKEDGWRIFHKIYPNAIGILTVSRVGFNKRSDQAIMYLDFVKGELNAVGRYILLDKVNSKWRIRKILEVWVS
jgi:hypothetical protein